MQYGYRRLFRHSVIEKLGIKPGMKVLLLNEPANYADLLETDISKQQCKKNETPDLVHLFAIGNKVFQAAMKKLQPVYQKNPAITFGYHGIN